MISGKGVLVGGNTSRTSTEIKKCLYACMHSALFSLTGGNRSGGGGGGGDFMLCTENSQGMMTIR